jgi:hypothetical protein
MYHPGPPISLPSKQLLPSSPPKHLTLFPLNAGIVSPPLLSSPTTPLGTEAELSDPVLQVYSVNLPGVVRGVSLALHCSAPFTIFPIDQWGGPIRQFCDNFGWGPPVGQFFQSCNAVHQCTPFTISMSICLQIAVDLWTMPSPWKSRSKVGDFLKIYTLNESLAAY